MKLICCFFVITEDVSISIYFSEMVTFVIK